MSNEYKKHSSWGVVRLSRVTCTPARTLFASPTKCGSYIQLEIAPAERKRDLSRDWIHGSFKSHIEVAMSETQFAQAITSMNIGSGTPCTVERIGCEQIDDPPAEELGEHLRSEMQDVVADTLNHLEEIGSKMEEVLGGAKPPSKKARAELLHMIRVAVGKTKGDLPFVAEKAQEALSDVVMRAKTEINAYFNNKVQEMGLKEGENAPITGLLEDGE